MLLTAQTISALATYPYIESITKGSTSASASVAYGSGVPPGYTGPLDPAYGNYYWWVDQQYYTAGNTSISIPYGTTNVCIYVYPDDFSGDYSTAIVDDYYGTTIWNGP